MKENAVPNEIPRMYFEDIEWGNPDVKRDLLSYVGRGPQMKVLVNELWNPAMYSASNDILGSVLFNNGSANIAIAFSTTLNRFRAKLPPEVGAYTLYGQGSTILTPTLEPNIWYTLPEVNDYVQGLALPDASTAFLAWTLAARVRPDEHELHTREGLFPSMYSLLETLVCCQQETATWDYIAASMPEVTAVADMRNTIWTHVSRLNSWFEVNRLALEIVSVRDVGYSLSFMENEAL